jgi:hypothetical protein
MVEKAQMAEIAATASSPAEIRNRNLRAQRLIIIFGVFAITMASPVVLAGLPLRFLLKGEMHVTQEQMAVFFFWCQLAFYLKPFAGILTDALPIFGTRRRHYLLISSVLAASSWIAMNFSSPHVRRDPVRCDGGESVHGYGVDGHWRISSRSRPEHRRDRRADGTANDGREFLRVGSRATREEVLELRVG